MIIKHGLVVLLLGFSLGTKAAESVQRLKLIATESVKTLKIQENESTSWHLQTCETKGPLGEKDCFKVKRVENGFDSTFVKDFCFRSVGIAIATTAMICSGKGLKYENRDLVHGIFYGVTLSSVMTLIRLGLNWKQNGHPLYKSKFDESLTVYCCDNQIATQDKEIHSCPVTQDYKEYEESYSYGHKHIKQSALLNAATDPKLYNDIKEFIKKTFQGKSTSDDFKDAYRHMLICQARKKGNIVEPESDEGKCRSKLYWEAMENLRRQQDPSA